MLGVASSHVSTGPPEWDRHSDLSEEIDWDPTSLQYSKGTSLERSVEAPNAGRPPEPYERTMRYISSVDINQIVWLARRLRVARGSSAPERFTAATVTDVPPACGRCTAHPPGRSTTLELAAYTASGVHPIAFTEHQGEGLVPVGMWM